MPHNDTGLGKEKGSVVLKEAAPSGTPRQHSTVNPFV